MSKMPSHHFSLGFLAEDIKKTHMVLQLVGRSEPDTRLSLLVSAFSKPALLLCSHFDEDSDDAKRVGECPALRSKDILRPALIYPYSFYGPAHRWRTLFLLDVVFGCKDTF